VQLLESGDPAMTLYPTHTCFDDALDFITLLVRHRQILNVWTTEWTIVHAMCQAPDGELYAHAWAETRDIAVSAAIIDGKHTYFETARREYYKYFRPVELNRYTISEAITLNYRHGHYGPWERRYREAAARVAAEGLRVWEGEPFTI
jgi:hypothetical protein